MSHGVPSSSSGLKENESLDLSRHTPLAVKTALFTVKIDERVIPS